MSNQSTNNNSTESRALALLGAGVGPEQVASALGCTASRISQLLSEPEFAAAVADLRFANLQKHNVLDSKYDEMEDQLVDRLKDCLSFMHKPAEILRAIQVINGAKRRGISAPEQITHQNQVINLVMPTVIMQKFTTSVTNQVVRVGEQTLETLQSGSLKTLASNTLNLAAAAAQENSNENGKQLLLEGVGTTG